MGRPPSSSTSATPSTGRGRIQCMFTIDCSEVVEDHVLDVAAFQKFLQEHMKIAVSRVFKEDRTTMRKFVKKPQNLSEYITISREERKIVITGDSSRLTKRYLKFTTKKFLKKNNNRDWLRVIASDEDPNAYVVQYFNASPNGENKNAAENREQKNIAEEAAESEENKKAPEIEEKKNTPENGKKKKKKKKKKKQKTDAKC